MHVSGIRPQEKIYNYNSIRMNVLRKDNVDMSFGDVKYDVKKAISDMAKDFALQQYQYFVGAGSNVALAEKSNTSFRTGENFVL